MTLPKNTTRKVGLCSWRPDQPSSLRAVLLLSKVEGNIAVLDHVPNLPFHHENEESDEVHDEDWPEDWDIRP